MDIILVKEWEDVLTLLGLFIGLGGLCLSYFAWKAAGSAEAAAKQAKDSVKATFRSVSAQRELFPSVKTLLQQIEQLIEEVNEAGDYEAMKNSFESQLSQTLKNANVLKDKEVRDCLEEAYKAFKRADFASNQSVKLKEVREQLQLANSILQYHSRYIGLENEQN